MIKKLKAKPIGQSEEQQHEMEQLLMRAKQETMAMQYDNRQLHKELTIKVYLSIYLSSIYLSIYPCLLIYIYLAISLFRLKQIFIYNRHLMNRLFSSDLHKEKFMIFKNKLIIYIGYYLVEWLVITLLEKSTILLQRRLVD